MYQIELWRTSYSMKTWIFWQDRFHFTPVLKQIFFPFPRHPNQTTNIMYVSHQNSKIIGKMTIFLMGLRPKKKVGRPCTGLHWSSAQGGPQIHSNFEKRGPEWSKNPWKMTIFLMGLRPKKKWACLAQSFIEVLHKEAHKSILILRKEDQNDRKILEKWLSFWWVWDQKKSGPALHRASLKFCTRRPTNLF